VDPSNAPGRLGSGVRSLARTGPIISYSGNYRVEGADLAAWSIWVGMKDGRARKSCITTVWRAISGS